MGDILVLQYFTSKKALREEESWDPERFGLTTCDPSLARERINVCIFFMCCVQSLANHDALHAFIYIWDLKVTQWLHMDWEVDFLFWGNEHVQSDSAATHHFILVCFVCMCDRVNFSDCATHMFRPVLRKSSLSQRRWTKGWKRAYREREEDVCLWEGRWMFMCY